MVQTDRYPYYTQATLELSDLPWHDAIARAALSAGETANQMRAQGHNVRSVEYQMLDDNYEPIPPGKTSRPVR